MSEESVQMRESTRNKRLSQTESIREWISRYSDLKCENFKQTEEDVKDNEYATMVENPQDTVKEDEYVTIGNYSQIEIETDRAIKLLTSFDYTVPPLNLKFQPIQENRTQLITTPLVTISRALNFRLFACMKLKEESVHSGGVEISVKLPDLFNMRFVRSGESIWVSRVGHRKGDRDIFFIGDRVISVDNKIILNMPTLQHIMASASHDQTLKFRLCRLPYAKIFAIKSTSYKSYFSFDKECQEFILNNSDTTKLVITGIDGVNVDGISTEEQLKSYFVETRDRYVTVIIQPLKFLWDSSIKSK